MASVDPKRALAVHAGLSGLYPVIETAEESEISFAAAQGTPPTVSSHAIPNWRFKSEDEQWTVAVTADFFALETTDYSTWDDFSGRLSELVRAVAAQLQPALEQRVGLRYVNRVSGPDDVESPAGWEGWIDRSFLGPLLHGTLAPALVSVQQVLQLQLASAERAVVRHGAESGSDGSEYLIDIDCFQQAGRPFDPEAIETVAQSLHTGCLQLFQTIITPQLLGRLKGDP